MNFVEMDISPTIAAEWLEQSAGNRTLSRATVDAYCRDMGSDSWRVNPQPIVRSEDSLTLDGHHRLAAIVQSAKTVRCVVCFGAKPECRAVIDTGRPRAFEHEIFFQNGTRYSASGRAAARVIMSIENSLEGSSKKWTAAEMSRIIEAYRPSYIWAYGLPKAHHRMGLAAFLGTLIYAHKYRPDRIAEFYAEVNSGAGLAAGSPALALRTHLLSKPVAGGGSQAMVDTVERTASAIEAYLSGRPVFLLKAGRIGFGRFMAAMRAGR